MHNATAPKGGAGLLALTNLQAGGVWSGIEFAFASFLMDHGRFADRVKVVEAIHRGYLRAGQPWNHMECGGHYYPAMSSWATMLAATGFKPDVPRQTLGIVPAIRGDVRAPWATASGFGTIFRKGRTLSIHCEAGALSLRYLKAETAVRSVRLAARVLNLHTTNTDDGVTLEFSRPSL